MRTIGGHLSSINGCQNHRMQDSSGDLETPAVRVLHSRLNGELPHLDMIKDNHTRESSDRDNTGLPG